MKQEKGSVTLEFGILLPFFLCLIYAAAIYGIVFSWQVRMQIAVDRATAAVMQLDRSSTNDPAGVAEALAQGALARTPMSFMVPPENACRLVNMAGDAAAEDGSDAAAVVCELFLELEAPNEGEARCDENASAVESSLTVGFFGGFPPLPGCLSASARVAF